MIYEDILGHQQPILLALHNTQQFLTDSSSELTTDVRKKLQDGSTSLQKRYETVVRDSETRTRQLSTGDEDLEQVEPDMAKFEEWLQSAERNLDKLTQNVGTDLDTLKKQVGTITFIFTLSLKFQMKYFL